MNKHLTDHQLLSYLDTQGESGKREHRERVEAHLLSCPACRARLERLSRTAALLSSTLDAVGTRVKLSPDRSWHTLRSRLEEQRARKNLPTLHLAFRYLVMLAVLLVIAGGIVGLLHTLAVTGPAQATATPAPSPVVTAPAGPAPTLAPLPRQQPYQMSLPLSILILGSDGESTDSDLVDTLMLLHLVQKEHKAEYAFIVSIPRNLYLELPGGDSTLAGSLYSLGKERSGNGLVFAGEVLSATLGMSVDRVVFLRLDGFVKLIDLIGGVEIDVPYPVEDRAFPDGRGGYDPLLIPAGRQLLDGVTALRYARTTVVPAPGFDRTFRQQQIALAVHERITQPGILTSLISRAPALWSAISDDVATNLSLNEAIDLALATSSLTVADITVISIEACCAVPQTIRGKGEVLLLQEKQLESLMRTPNISGGER
ncbi:MAG: LCP family protein [Anaerolineae bacterium]|nr:LCP family protein [Anaerolineae bacterium]